MTLFKRVIFIGCCILVLVAPGFAQDAVPTLPVPTPVPQPDTGAGFVNLTESSLARIAREGRMRVGILFNEPPFGELSITGEVEGFDAALATTIAEVWGVEVDFVQVTRLNAVEMLQRGQVDMLMAAMVHQRNLDAQVQFTQSYRIGRQAMMVVADSDLVNPVNASGRRIAYVAGTDSDTALQGFLSATGLDMQLQPYLTLDSAFVALFAGSIDALVGRETHLLQVAEQHLDEIKLLDGAIQTESYAIAVHPRDTPLRQFLNQTLQSMLLSTDQKLETLYDDYFPGVDLPYDALMLWQNVPLIDEFPSPGSVNPALDAGTVSMVERLRNGAALRVAGIPDLSPEASLIDQRINGLNRQLVENMATRWGTTVQYVSGDPMQLLTSGQADLAAGIEANWQLADRLDFSMPYLLHGDRLMVESRDDIASFQDLGGRWIGIMDTDTGAGDRAQAWADSISRTVRLYSTFEQTAADAMLVENNADVVYGNSLKLIQHLEANPNVLTLTERWYSREYFVFAMPANDPEFRLLVDYSIQELIKTADLMILARPLMPSDSELPEFEVWYGTYPGNLPGF